jgi:hypothetical protein
MDRRDHLPDRPAGGDRRLRLHLLKTPVALALAAACAGCSALPRRDVFVPPYAEKGCWARLYAENGFAGEMRQLEGPIFVEAMAGSPVVVPNMSQAGAQPLFNEVRSIAVGPHAKLRGYADTLFRKPTIALAPGSTVPDAQALAFHERVQSFEVLCEAGEPGEAG